MNVRDSEVICGLLKQAGFTIADEPKGADVIIFNTCSVRQHAEDKVWSEIGRYKKGKVIGLIGCMAKNYQQNAFDRAPNLSFVVGPQDIEKIPEIIKRMTDAREGTLPSGGSPLFERKIWETDGQVRPDAIYQTGFREDKGHAYVVISEGCSNFCSYCVVPYVRGALRHRKHKDVIKEIESALCKGISEITLLGQNVNAYKDEGVDFIKLIELVNGMKSLEQFSFITSHPKDASAEFFKAMAGCAKLKPYLHMPIQSGSDKMLKLMNRGYSRRYYLDLAHNYRKIIKAGRLSTDIIVGFPTETEEDFQDTYKLVEEVQFDSAFIFKYSVRPHTEAAKMADDVERGVKEERHKLILDLQKGISSKK